MKFALFILPTIPGTLAERRELRPIGRNRERYQQMLKEVRDIAVLADEVGIELMCTTEHHFHSEGFEVSVAPLVLYADLAARTKRLKFAPLSFVIPAWDPIRLAEETAVLDHLTGGRFCVGLARGYQDRWVNVLGQHYGVKGAPMDGSPDDLANRDVFEELIEVVKKAWTQDSWHHKGKHYEVPAPYETGITRWPAWEMTKEYGAPGELDEHNVVRKISVVPAPFQQPYPPIFQSFSMSPKTIEYAAKNSIVPFILKSYPPDFAALCDLYQEGRRGERPQARPWAGPRLPAIGPFRQNRGRGGRASSPHPLPILLRLFRRLRLLGCLASARRRREISDESVHAAAQVRVDPGPHAEGEVSLVGTVDDIKREIEALVRCHGDNGGKLEWFAWYFDQGLMSWDDARRQLEIFAEHIIPEFGD